MNSALTIYDKAAGQPTPGGATTTFADFFPPPPGDGEPGGVFGFIVTLLNGDANLNNLVDIGGDGFIVVANVTLANRKFTTGDFTGDGMTEIGPDGFVVVANLDLNRQIVAILGDVDGDGDVDDIDYYEWDDVNGDGEIDQDDLDVILSQMGLHYVA